MRVTVELPRPFGYANNTLTAAGRKLRSAAEKIPACVAQAAQCPVQELVQLTRQIQSLRDRLAA